MIDEAIRLNPQYTKAYNNRGFLHRLIGNLIEAERDFAKAKELGNSPQVILDKANISMEEVDFFHFAMEATMTSLERSYQLRMGLIPLP